jgi:2-oxoisovalerate ferredoxin oxidoreductase alpha subunit
MATRLSKGNSAAVAGALYAGCDCFFGYPITPASEILHDASLHFPRLGRVFVQAESEEAAINMVYGAAASGKRVMTASSGPGISLKQEGMSFLAGTELPMVLVDIMRAGPGLGNIGPEQSDYNQIVKGGGHGSYRNIVLAPGSVQEMCDFTMEAFELAERYRNPVVVLADGVLGQMIEPLNLPDAVVEPKTDTSWAVAGTAETSENCITSIFLDFDVLERFNLKLQAKYRQIEEDEQASESYRVDDADVVVVAYGISSRIARSAVDAAREEGIAAGLFRPTRLYPFPRRALRQVAERDVRFLCIELSEGQMRDDVRLAIECRRPVALVNRFGGHLVTHEAALAAIRKLAGRG